MNKKILLVALPAALMASASYASDFTGGLEIDNKFSADKVEDLGTGAKLFMGYKGLTLSAKRNDVKAKEYNFNYKHDFDSFFLKGEYEFVDNRSRVTRTGENSTGADVNKFGITVGTNVMDIFDTSFRLRKDLDAKEMNGTKSDITRFDLAVGKQFENVYFNTKLVGQHQADARIATVNDTIYNVEARLTFNNISDNFTPYFEAGNEAKFGSNDRDTYGKVGVIFNF